VVFAVGVVVGLVVVFNSSYVWFWLVSSVCLCLCGRVAFRCWSLCARVLDIVFGWGRVITYVFRYTLECRIIYNLLSYYSIALISFI